MTAILRLLSDEEYRGAMRRIDELMNTKGDAELRELDILVDHVVAYEALDDATDALITYFRAHTATRNDPKLRKVYRDRAEIVIRAWTAAISSQSKRPLKAPSDGGSNG